MLSLRYVTFLFLIAAGPTRPNYPAVVKKAAAMVTDLEAQRLAAARGLQIMNVTWEDTGRYKGSAVGPNISDMTIQVATEGELGRLDVTTMPVIRMVVSASPNQYQAASAFST